MAQNHVVDAEPATFTFGVPEARATVTRGKPPKPPWHKRLADVLEWTIRLKRAADEFGLTDLIQSWFNRVTRVQERKASDAGFWSGY